MSIVNTLSVLITLGIFLFLPEVSHGQQPKKFEILSIGVRGGINLDSGGLPPGEKEDFQQFDVFAILGFPGSWEWPRGWEARYRWYASAGVLKAAGDRGFIATSGPGVTFTKWDWNLSLDFGTGAVFVGDETFGRQDFGGPVQILGNGGISYHFPGNIRELKNIIERAAYRDVTNEITPVDIGMLSKDDIALESGSYLEKVDAFGKRLLLDALNKAGGYQDEHRAYDKAGHPCPACGAAIVRIVQAQRSTFFCPVCQRKR